MIAFFKLFANPLANSIFSKEMKLLSTFKSTYGLYDSNRLPNHCLQSKQHQQHIVISRINPHKSWWQQVEIYYCSTNNQNRHLAIMYSIIGSLKAKLKTLPYKLQIYRVQFSYKKLRFFFFWNVPPRMKSLRFVSNEEFEMGETRTSAPAISTITIQTFIWRKFQCFLDKTKKWWTSPSDLL